MTRNPSPHFSPFVRRRWPQILVSWTRLLSGEWRDPLVARDLLIGSSAAALIQCVRLFSRDILPSWLGFAELTQPQAFLFQSAMGSRFFASQFLLQVRTGIFLALLMICFLYVMQILLKNKKAAIAASIIFVSFLLMGSFDNFAGYPIGLVMASVYIFVLARFGLLAVALMLFAVLILRDFPATLDSSAWYFGYGFAAVAIFAAIVLYAFRTSLGGRPLLAPSHLDD